MRKYLSDSLPNRTVKIRDEGEYLWFSGTDYLGLGNNEEFRSYLQEGIVTYGSHFGSSRNNSLQFNIYQETEIALASFTEAASALTVSSGMWAGQVLMKEIENIISNSIPFSKSHAFQYHYAPKVHPALWGNQYVQNLGSWKDWAIETIQLIHGSSENITHIICTDSVGSPFVEEFDISIFDSLPDEKNVWMIIDDSHGLGVSGNSGNGIYSKIASGNMFRTIVVASLNKAMGIPAGVILADTDAIEVIRNSPWFSGASPFAPAHCFAFKKFLDNNSYEKVFGLLKSNIRYFQNLILNTGIFTGIDDYPVFCSRNMSLFQHLLDNRIMASCFSYPSATDLPVTRIAISTIHQKEDLDRLAEVCLKFKE